MRECAAWRSFFSRPSWTIALGLRIVSGRWQKVDLGGPWLPVSIGVSINWDTPKSSMFIGYFFVNHRFWGTPHPWKRPYIGQAQAVKRGNSPVISCGSQAGASIGHSFFGIFPKCWHPMPSAARFTGAVAMIFKIFQNDVRKGYPRHDLITSFCLLQMLLLIHPMMLIHQQYSNDGIYLVKNLAGHDNTGQPRRQRSFCLGWLPEFFTGPAFTMQWRNLELKTKVFGRDNGMGIYYLTMIPVRENSGVVIICPEQ